MAWQYLTALMTQETSTDARSNKRRSTAPVLCPMLEPRTPRSRKDSSDLTGTGAGFLASTGYLIRLAHNNKLLPQDKGVLLGDRGSLPIIPQVPPPKRNAVSPKPVWPLDVPRMCVGAHVRIGANKLGIVDKWLPVKSKWAVTLASGEKKAYAEGSMQAISTRISRRQKVKVLDAVVISADPEDINDQDVTLACGTRGIITAVDEDDGGAYMEFECLPGSEVPIEGDSFDKFQFYDEELGIWTYFHECIQAQPGNLVSSSCDVEQPVWSIEQTALLCELGGEATFEAKSNLLSRNDIVSVSAAVAYLNSSEGFMGFLDGHCVVFSELKQRYFLLYRSDKQALALSLFNLTL